MSGKKDALSKWINDQWDSEREVLFHELHFNLSEDEAKHYEKDWRGNLSNLLKGKSLSYITDKEQKLTNGLKEVYSNNS